MRNKLNIAKNNKKIPATEPKNFYPALHTHNNILKEGKQYFGTLFITQWGMYMEAGFLFDSLTDNTFLVVLHMVLDIIPSVTQ